MLRGAYHRALRAAERVYDLEVLESFIESSKSSGIAALYGLFRKNSGSNIVDPSSFREYCENLFKSTSKTIFSRITTCEQLYHELTADLSMEEVRTTIDKFKSKATTTLGILRRL